MPVADVETLIEDEKLSDEVPPDDAADGTQEAASDPSHLADAPESVAIDEPLEIPTTDEGIEQIENQDPGGPNDDLAPPMNDPGPMEPPFTEPDDLTPIDPEPGPPDSDPVPGPNPDEPEGPAGPVE